MNYESNVIKVHMGHLAIHQNNKPEVVGRDYRELFCTIFTPCV